MDLQSRLPIPGTHGQAVIEGGQITRLLMKVVDDNDI